MSKSKKKREKARQTANTQAQESQIASADSPVAREAETVEDAARSGDSEALSPEEEEKPQPEPSRRSLREEKLRRADAFRKRKPDLTHGQAMRHVRARHAATRALRTPNRHDTGLPVRRHPVRTTLATLCSLLAITLVGAYFAFDVSEWQKLDVNKITAAPQTGLMYDNEGALLTKIRGAENRVVIPLEQIPLHTQQAFLAAEDLRFYSHKGVDVVRLFGALAANIRQGGYAQGGSTITMQLIRQSHLSTQKTISRKLEEIWLAFQLERQMSKDEILAMYLNYIYFGNGAYGIQAAAQTYFDVDAAELSLAQAAALAASIKAPSYYSPTADAQANRTRRNYILSTMLSNGMVSTAEYENAANETVNVAQREPETLEHGWFVDAVLDEAERLLGMSSDQVLTGGFIIDTTLSREHQRVLEEQFTRDVFPANAADGTKVQAAAACVNVRSGAVLAVVGGREYEVRRGFNRATQLRRQPGSALKPLAVYAPAIDRFGYTPASVLKDEPTNFNGYKPRNAGYTYYGNVSIRSALTSSLNVAAVALMNQIGVQAGRDYLSSVGISLDDRDANLSLALGSMTYGVSPVELAAAYVPFGNGGTFHSPYFIRRIADPTGRILYQRREDGTRVLKTTSAYLMTSLMQSVTSTGTGAKLSAAGTPVAGKTGTVNMTGGNRDIWMAAYNPEIACAFWMGFDAPDAQHKLQSWVSGGDHTAAMARNYFKALYQNRDKPQFTRPDGIVALEIDKQSIKWRGEAMLAVDLTPKNYRYTEYFADGNHPTKKSDVWTPPRALNSFTVGHSEAGYPLLKLQPADTALYRVQRDTYGESFVLTELYGSKGETLYYTDTSAKPGIVYTYRIIPVHAELLNNGVLLEGVQSVQVAQANLPAQGFWGRIRDWLQSDDDDDGNAVTSMTENQASMFWGE